MSNTAKDIVRLFLSKSSVNVGLIEHLSRIKRPKKEDNRMEEKFFGSIDTKKEKTE